MDVLNTLALVEHQIKDFCEHARTNHFGCHAVATLNGTFNLADRDPVVPVGSFDQDTASL